MGHMIRIEGRERVEGFERHDVFRAGIRTENWPTTKEGLTICPRDEIVVPGTRVDVGLAIAAISIHVNGEVTKYEEGNSLLIEGESSLVGARVGIELADRSDSCLTEVEYKVTIKGKPLHIRLAEPAVREFLKHAIPAFARGYSQNVSEYLHAESVTAPS